MSKHTEEVSLLEKISLLSGNSLWTIPGIATLESITVSDGPHGVRKPLSDLSLQEAHPATCFPAGCAIAASWSTEAIHRLGEALARECEFYHISILLGPAMNLKRHAAGGRNLEYFSEDPYLTGTLAAAYVKGVQSTGRVGACLKHFAANNQESHRFVVNAMVDERSLRELYLKSFHIAIQAEPAMIMGAYNRLNGIYCCENKWLLQDILRKEWRYQGVCVTDWGATNDRVAAVRAGMDLEMPGNEGLHNEILLQECQNDPSLEACIDTSAGRIRNLLQQYQPPSSTNNDVFDVNNQVAYELALECTVLLKNNHNILPLARNTRLAVIGEFAKDSRYQGMGSSHCTPTRVAHALDALHKYTALIDYAPGYCALAVDDTLHPELVEEAKMVASKGDVVLIFLGLPEILESEGFDRKTLRLPKQHIALLEAITAIHNKVVVVLSNGGTVELPDCVSAVSGLVEGYLLGQAGGLAIVDLIFGIVSPSGRLPETMPLTSECLPSHNFFPGTRDRVEYREGLNVGYRFFDSIDDPSKVRFPFGHGLTYTDFAYSDLHVDAALDESDAKEVHVHFRLTNIGSHSAKEVPQCYVSSLQSSVYRPRHELKAFSKILLHPGESQQVSFTLQLDAFTFYDIGYSRWIVEAGKYEIQIAADSQQIHLRRIITFQTGESPSELALESYPTMNGMSTDDKVYAQRFGLEKDKILDSIRLSQEPRPIPCLDRNSLLKEAAAFSMIAKGLFFVVCQIGCREIPAGPMKKAQIHMVRANVENLPLRTLVLFSKGALSMEVLDGVISLMNGNILHAMQLFGVTMMQKWRKRK